MSQSMFQPPLSHKYFVNGSSGHTIVLAALISSVVFLMLQHTDGGGDAAFQAILNLP